MGGRGFLPTYSTYERKSLINGIIDREADVQKLVEATKQLCKQISYLPSDALNKLLAKTLTVETALAKFTKGDSQ